MILLNLHVEFGLKHTMVLQLSYGVFWIERLSNRFHFPSSLLFCPEDEDNMDSKYWYLHNKLNGIRKPQSSTSSLLLNTSGYESLNGSVVVWYWRYFFRPRASK
jgi:hypothetical protein